MSNLLNSFRQNVYDARRWVAAKMAPVWAFLAPTIDRWRQATAPLRQRWTDFRQRSPRFATIVRWFGWIVLAGLSALMLLILSVWIGLFGRLPATDELRAIENPLATEIYTMDSVLIGKYFIENRTDIGLENVSPHIVSALIATEDRRFLEHQGIDIHSWFRIGYAMLLGRESGGGSTLSQQLAKNLYPRKKYWVPGLGLIVSKIRENFISVRLEKIYNKQELLNLYLNTVPFGNEAFGINVASRQFFNKKPKDLSVDQAAMLVGMLKGTTIYNPVRNPENARKRRNVVLMQMVNNKDLSRQEYDDYSKKPVGAKNYKVDDNNDGLGTYFREYLRTEVMPNILAKTLKEDGTKYNLYTDGLKIYTTLHSTMQQYAEEAVQKQMQDLQQKFDQHWKNYKKDKPWGDDKWIEQQIKRSARWDALKDAGVSDEENRKAFNNPVRMTIFGWKNGGSDVDTTLSPLDSVRYYFCMLNCGFMAMDHRNGFVRAWVGGTNFKYFKFDHILSERQVGSTFKPIVYAAALQDSIKPCDYFPNQIKKIVDWEPHNSDEKYGGWYTMMGALTKSVNVVAAQLIEKVGIQKTIDLAKKMGITSTLPREYGISLGAADIDLYDMMKVYGTIANQGVRPEPVLVLGITGRNGEVLYNYKEQLKTNPDLGPHERALTVNQAATMTKMLQNVINYGTGARLRNSFGIQGDFAGKTGTTQNNSDGWFICYNPQLVTGSWVGASSPAVRFRSMTLGQGSAMALPIVAWFWNKVANDKKLGKLLSEKFPDAKPEVQALFGCYPWIGINPDSFSVRMQDSTFRDSLQQVGASRSNKTPGGEVGTDEDSGKDKKPKDGEKKSDGLFRRLFNHKPEDDKKPGGEENKRQQ
ncbi:MAG: transglycosylase domain-containing protein [Saprospiraceae bacterium]